MLLELVRISPDPRTIFSLEVFYENPRFIEILKFSPVEVIVGRKDERRKEKRRKEGVGEAGADGRSVLRFFDCAPWAHKARSMLNVEGSIQARGGKETDGKGMKRRRS